MHIKTSVVVTLKKRNTAIWSAQYDCWKKTDSSAKNTWWQLLNNRRFL